MADSHGEPEFKKKRPRKVKEIRHQSSLTDKMTDLNRNAPPQDWLIGGGKMGDLVRSLDWSATPLGPRHNWPPSLRTTVNTILATRFPMCLLWGDDLIMIYNEGYRIIAADKHPRALGGSSREIWPEVWEFNKPIFERVMTRRETVYLEDQVYSVARKGYLEQAFFTICYSPVCDESGDVGGTLVTLLETTQRIKAEDSLRAERKQAEDALKLTQVSIDSAAEMVAWFTPDGGVYYANDATCRTLGYSREELLKMSALDFSPGFTKEQYEEHWQEVRKRKSLTLQPVHRRKDGTTYSAEVLVNHVVYGGREFIFAYGTDITARKAAEETLRQRAEEVERLLESVPAAVWVAHDSQCRMITGNRRANEFYEAETGENVSATMLPEARRFLTPDGHELPAEELPMQKAVATNRDVRDVELHVQLPSGRRIAMLGSAVPLRDQAGSARGCIGTFLDITERKLTEEALRRSEARYRVLHESMRDAFVQVAMDGQIVDFNDVYCQMLGYTPDEVRELTYQAITPERWHEFEQRVVQEQIIARGYSDVYEKEYRRKDGTVFPVELRTILLRDEAGRPAGMWGIIRDITDRKQAERALQESRRQLDILMQNLHSAVALIDEQGKFSIVNPAFMRMFGIEATADIKNVNDRDWGEWRVYDENGQLLETDEHPVRKASMTGKPVRDKLVGVLSPSDKDLKWMLISAEPILRPDGQTGPVICTYYDITERKRAERMLQAANEQLKIADRHKDEFLAMLAHELRNPLAAITNAIELLKMRGPADPTLMRARNSASRQAVHMVRLLDDLLDVARVTRRKISLKKEDVSLHSILESAVDASNTVMNARNHRLFVSHPKQKMHVHGDPVRLSQAIGNLLDNAAKYTQPGGEIYLLADREGDQAMIRVRDNGKGIEPELLPRVFELFVQGSRAADRAEGGLGIGLTIVKSLVELHGGRVEARSDGPGSGSEFSIWLPLLPAVEESVLDKAIREAEDRQPLRILVVDDNVDSAELLSVLLELEGHKVMVANSGQAAIDPALQNVPDVALVDIGMPGMDGYEVARRMRNFKELKDMKLIAVTGYGQQEDIQKSRDAGFHDHLVKPVELETLKTVLQRIGRRSTR